MMPCQLLLIPGSLRRRSTTTAVLRTVEELAVDTIATAFYDGMGSLPHFNPDDDGVRPPDAVVGLRRAIRSADALLFSVPEYAGDLPGSFKNLLDWTIGDGEERSIYNKPVAWINASPRGAVEAHESLRRVLGYAHATTVTSACADIPVTGAMIDQDGLIGDMEVRTRLRQAIGALIAHLRMLRCHGQAAERGDQDGAPLL